jgi:ubiquinone/menaquinone biosynthesis C-methylase UbiE
MTTPTQRAPKAENFPGHRLFAGLWDRASRHEGAAQSQLRRDTVGKVHGRVLELGFGVGANWRYLPEGIEYTGIEPDPFMLARARKHATGTGREMSLHQARAEALPFDDETFDSVLVTLTLCSVDNPARALSEARRVLKPGGSIVFLEHVRPAGWFMGGLADGVTPLWRRAFAGCHPNRLTEQSITGAQFELDEIRRTRLAGLPTISGGAHKAPPPIR